MAEEAKRISDNIIKEQAPMVEFAKTAEVAQETDMLIREVREKLEAHGYDIARRIFEYCLRIRSSSLRPVRGGCFPKG